MTRWAGWLRHRAVRWGAAGMDLLFPPACACCRAEIPLRDDPILLCPDCRRALGPEVWHGCTRCGAAWPDGVDPAPPCRLCRGPRLRFDAAIVLGGYSGDLRAAVLRMKRSSEEALSSAVGGLFAVRRRENLAAARPDLIVPVPMYWSRRLRRGTNSPQIIAQRLSHKVGVPYHPKVLVRRRNTRPQARLAPRERFRNVRGAFRVRAGYPLDGLRVMLVDDILTTGATCSEAAGVLKDAGAAEVIAAVVARAQGESDP